MSVLYLVVPLAVAVVAFALGAFVWATRQGQFDDLDTPAVRMLNDDAVRRDVPSGSRAASESPSRGSSDGRADRASKV